ncbi:MAG: Ribonuclease 3 [Syntrophorhabdus sp. PtaU1.Bin050]|nr:MAG: Ribonuclease 3 [Syntrophorhabdus sp. PtaU1.Bin050]
MNLCGGRCGAVFAPLSPWFLPVDLTHTMLENIIEYTFKNKELLNQAITHSSCFNEKKDVRQSENEKLEYLGDAILNSVITILLYKKFKDKDEGFLSNARSCLVKRETLTEVAKAIDLPRHMFYGNGDQNVPEDSKVLSNMVEALIGAIYLDGGLRKATKVIKNLFAPYFSLERLTEKNPKNLLQEYSQKRWSILPKYKFTRKTKGGFTVIVYIGKDLKAKGMGKSKKEAEQHAARLLLQGLTETDGA